MVLLQAFHFLLDYVWVVAPSSRFYLDRTPLHLLKVKTLVLFCSDSSATGTLSSSPPFVVTVLIAFAELQRVIFPAHLACNPSCSHGSSACEQGVLTLALAKNYDYLPYALSYSGLHRGCRVPFRNFQGTVSSLREFQEIVLLLLLAVLRPKCTLCYF